LEDNIKMDYKERHGSVWIGFIWTLENAAMNFKVS
jgi:hypothetical protein